MSAHENLSQIRAVQSTWAASDLSERIARLAALRRAIVARLPEIVDSICDWTRKVPTEALIGELYPVLDLLRYYEKNAQSILRRKRVSRRFSFPNSSAFYEYRPFGIAAIFSPWNLPFQLSMVPAFSALTAGNAVVLKPSEITPEVGALLLSLFSEAGYPEGLVTVVYGDRDAGARLIRQRPDLIFFTGGSDSGKAVMKQAAEYLIPVVLELGGKDPMIVCSDAPWERSLNAAVYGAFCNAGQLCVSVERLLVDQSIHDRFVKELETKIETLNIGSGLGNDVGPMISEHHANRVEHQVREALADGACTHPAFRREGRLIHPLLLTRVTPEMSIWKQENFGPVLPVLSFADPDEAIRLANDSAYGLNASVWTQDLEKGRRIAARLEVGTCAVNDVIKNAGYPDLPFGGVKHSGFGCYHGPQGLWTFCRPQSTMVNSGHLRTEVNWFPYSPDLHQHILRMMRLFHSGNAGVRDWIGALPTFRYFRRFMQ